MRILFTGTGGFAAPSLTALLESRHEVIGVVTQPDRPSGRGLRARVSPIKEIALSAGIPVYQPEKVREEESIQLVRELSPDLIVVAAFGQIIPRAILDIPELGCVNVHASLLPRHRGAAPVHYALFCGDEKTGVTTMLMDPGLDTGPILLQREVEIHPEDNEGTLEARLADVGAGLLLETLESLERGEVTPQPQDDSQATHAPSVKREECRIDWQLNARDIVNRIRGCTPRPGAHTSLQGVALKVWKAHVAELDSGAEEPGEVLDVTADGIVMQAGCGSVLLIEVQPENRTRMRASDFARGHRVYKGSKP